MQVLVLLVELVVNELYFSIAVTIDAPTHAEIRDLTDPVHLFNGTVTGGTVDVSYTHVLGVTEKNMVLQVVNPDPFNRLSLLKGIHHLGDLVLSGIASVPDNGVAVPADIYIWDTRRLGMSDGGMAILAVDLIVASVNRMGKLDRLVGLIILLPP